MQQEHLTLPDLPDLAELPDRLEAVRQRVRTAMQTAGRSLDEVTLVAVSKLHSAEAVLAVALAGQRHFGENYMQEACAKQDALAAEAQCPPLTWHFTGHVQSRKAKEVVGRFTLIHTLDTEKLAKIMDRLAGEQGLRQAVLIQVNVGAEEQKSGVSLADLPALAEAVAQCPHLDLQGLMCLPPVFDAGLEARPHFALLRKQRELLRLRLGLPLPHLSMGMSGDLEAAVLEGATLVRVGTDIFGARQYT